MLFNRNFLTLLDFSSSEIDYLLNLALRLKKQKKKGKVKKHLKGKNIALIFEKSSTRTRCAFEVAAYDMGGNAIYLSPAETQIGHKESIKDTARVLGRMFDAIEYRGYSHETVETLAKYAGVPVWNGLTDQHHPTQVLADFMTIKEHCNKALNQVSFAYLGDARNNVANSLLSGGALMGMDIRMVGPQSLQPDKDLVKLCRTKAAESGAKISISSSLEEGVKGADFIYTDVWVSMGEPENVWQERIRLLNPYRVDSKLMMLAGKDAKFLHCLPAYHNRDTIIGENIFRNFGIDGVEVSNEVFESDASLVFDQAENRLHTIKAVMLATLGKAKK